MNAFVYADFLKEKLFNLKIEHYSKNAEISLDYLFSTWFSSHIISSVFCTSARIILSCKSKFNELFNVAFRYKRELLSIKLIMELNLRIVQK